ncbi:carph-isopro domain-containing protein [Novosphingobium sp. Rr 2-17]|uniref:carph-isopro domain-containing protein n=1 Tax=Novosphingobium sp. Rr 2-17 TaxID=555793 RepID=UPI001ED8FC13|nr:hypothetical protein [Novosphingobium sp. Rr 2-17]
MQHADNIFAIFGGIRPMARKLGEAPANVSAWKTQGRIPAQKQPHVLAVAVNLGLPVTAENVVFPLGRPDADVAATNAPVVCDHPTKAQWKDAA